MSSVPQPAPIGGPLDPEPAGRLVAWLAAIVAARAQVETAAAAVEAGGSGHVVSGLPGASPEISLLDALGWLRDERPRSATMVLPAAGDPLGLTEPGPFTDAALAAESGVVIECASGSFGWAPEADVRGSSYVGVRWRCYDASIQIPPISLEPQRILEQSERALRRALRSATDLLSEIDLAHWRPEAVSGRGAADAVMRGRARALPPGWPPSALALADRALALARVVRVAASVPGAASASAGMTRAAALRELSRAVREALTTAYNVPAAAMFKAARG